jgi:hypothetical protein
MYGEPAEREFCGVCGRSISSKTAGVYEGSGCLWCRGDPEPEEDEDDD